MNKLNNITLARLAAIQSFFQTFFNNKSLNLITNEFNIFRRNKILDKSSLKLSYNKKYYNNLMLNIEKFDIKYDSNIFFSKYIKHKRPYERLDTITKAILIVSASEILYNKELNKKIIINDYINIAKSFLNKSEVSFINALLDKIYEYEKK